MAHREESTTADPNVPAEPDWTEDQERALRLWIVLARCYGTFAREVASKVAEYGLTTAQFGILEALRHIGPMPLGELAEKLLVTGGNVTYVMDRLEDEGLVYRERSGRDRRIVKAKLTEEGRSLVDDVFPGHAAFIERLAGHLAPEEQEELRSLLKKLGHGVAGDGASA